MTLDEAITKARVDFANVVGTVIEAPDGSSDPTHDHTTQYHVFGYFENILDDSNRVALMLGSSVGKFQIPDLNGEQPSLGLNVNGQTAYPSSGPR